MITLKITFYKNIKNVLILGGKKGGGGVNLLSGQNFFHNKSEFVFTKTLMINYEDECYDFQDELFNFEQILRMSRDN